MGKSMKLLRDVHTHTNYSHGENTIEEMVKKAVEVGLEEIQITEHGRFHYYARKLNYERYLEMRNEVERLKPLYPQINILFGIESNVISTSGEIDVSSEEAKLFDVINVGFHCLCRLRFSAYFKFHLLFVLAYKLKLKCFVKPSYNACTKAMIKTLERNNINMIAHPTSNYRFDIVEVAKKCEETNTILEINDSRGEMSVEDVLLVKDMNVKFAVGSDAHSIRRVGSCDRAFEIIRDSGLDINKIVNVVEE